MKHSTRALVPRGIDSSCARPVAGEHGDVLSIGITTQTLLKILTAVFLILTLLNSIFHITRHLTRYTIPRQQRQIIRIILVPTVFAIFSFLSVLSYQASIYLRPLAEIYESICIPALFLLYVDYIYPDSHSWWDILDAQGKRGILTAGSCLAWFKRTCILVFQYPLSKTISSIVEIATQGAGVYCVNTLDPHYAHLWCEIINIVAIMVAAPHVVRFERRMKKHINTKHRPGLKLWTFKGFVFLQFVQLVLFGLLNGQTFSPTSYVTYDDLYYGIPSMVTCIEAWIFTSIFIWSFSTTDFYAPPFD
ncbi:organic solute transporter subunit alpha/Transmembrane protein [Trichoderma evansii]